MRLSEFGKAIGTGRGQEAGRDVLKRVFERKPISLATVLEAQRIKDYYVTGLKENG
jgi:hypothetical protein